MANWKCEECGHVHSSNPSKCSNCGHVILQQTDESAGLLDRLLPWR